MMYTFNTLRHTIYDTLREIRWFGFNLNTREKHGISRTRLHTIRRDAFLDYNFEIYRNAILRESKLELDAIHTIARAPLEPPPPASFSELGG